MMSLVQADTAITMTRDLSADGAASVIRAGQMGGLRQ